MAEEIVVKEPLTKEMIEVGSDMTQRLLDKGFEIVCSLWLYNVESSRWRLVLASPVVDREGPRRAYEVIQEILQENWEMDIWLRDISALSPNDPTILAFRSLGKIDLPRPAYDKTPRTNGRRRYTLSRLGDLFIEDAYVYLVN